MAVGICLLGQFRTDAAGKAIVVKQAGFVPSIASSLRPKSAHLQTIEQSCRQYCQYLDKPEQPAPFLSGLTFAGPQQNALVPEDEAVYSKMLCRAESEEQPRTVFIVKGSKKEPMQGV